MRLGQVELVDGERRLAHALAVEHHVGAGRRRRHLDHLLVRHQRGVNLVARLRLELDLPIVKALERQLDRVHLLRVEPRQRRRRHAFDRLAVERDRRARRIRRDRHRQPGRLLDRRRRRRLLVRLARVRRLGRRRRRLRTIALGLGRHRLGRLGRIGLRHLRAFRLRRRYRRLLCCCAGLGVSSPPAPLRKIV